MSAIRGKRILVVEDEPLVAMALEDMLLKLGAEVVGPAATVSRALELAQTAALDAALLDVNLRGEQSDPVAAALDARCVPYVFATGYGAEVRERRPNALIVDKPFQSGAVEHALARVLTAR